MNLSLMRPLTAGFLLVTLAACNGGSSQPEIDLQGVLDVTLDSLMEMEGATSDRGTAADVAATGAEAGPDDTVELLLGFTGVLQDNYNAREPALHEDAITVAPQQDASFLALADANDNGQPDEGEDALWLIEIDGENARIVATDRSGAVSQSGFSGTSLLAGYFLARMLTRQRGAGVNTRALAGKRPVSASQAARARAGSGSFSRGK